MRIILESTPLAFCLWLLFRWPASAAETISVSDAQHAMWSAMGLGLLAVLIIAKHFSRRPM